MSGEKKHDPTQKKKLDSKDKGQVALSKDIQTLGKLSLFFTLLFATSSIIQSEFYNLLDSLSIAAFDQKWVLSSDAAWSSIYLFLKLVIACLLVNILVATALNWAQTGLVISAEAATPSMKKLNPVDNIKNLFSKKSMIQLLASVGKVIVIVWLTFLIVSDNLNNIILSYRVSLNDMFVVLSEVLKDSVIYCMIALLVFVAIDWAAVYMHHIKSIRMSDQDLKDEAKETQGNPETKNRLRSERRNLLHSSLSRMDRAKVVVANPTHISVALDYEPGVHDIPYIIAMGEDEVALEIRREAKRLNIPIVSNIKLARALYSDCEEDEYIQTQHLELAATVFKSIIEAANHPKMPSK